MKHLQSGTNPPLHPTDVDITTLTPEELHYQLDLLETALWKILGVKPRFFRPPFGEYDNKSLKVLQERGYSGACGDVSVRRAMRRPGMLILSWFFFRPQWSFGTLPLRTRMELRPRSRSRATRTFSGPFRRHTSR